VAGLVAALVLLPAPAGAAKKVAVTVMLDLDPSHHSAGSAAAALKPLVVVKVW